MLGSGEPAQLGDADIQRAAAVDRPGEHLIAAGYAYVDEQTPEQMRTNRGDFGLGSPSLTGLCAGWHQPQPEKTLPFELLKPHLPKSIAPAPIPTITAPPSNACAIASMTGVPSTASIKRWISPPPM